MTELLKQWMGDYHMLSDLDRYGYLTEKGWRDEGRDGEEGDERMGVETERVEIDGG